MKNIFLALSLSFTLILVPTSLARQKASGTPTAPEQKREVLRNAQGDVILDSSGRQINYPKQQLQPEASLLAVQPPGGTTSPSLPDTEPVWSYSVFGSGIGGSNIIVGRNGSATEMYMAGSSGGFGGNGYWYVLRYNASSNDYEQVYVSRFFTEGISRMLLANVIGDSRDEIIVALRNGKILLYDQATRRLLQTLTTSASELLGLDIADIDADGANDLILSTRDRIYVYSGSGTLKWSVINAGGWDIVVAQMDNDSALEIAATGDFDTGGFVVDAGTHLIQWVYSTGFGRSLEAADIDGDNKKELIVAEFWGFVAAYDVDQQLQKWTIPTPQDIGAIRVVDIDNDSVQDLLIGDGQWGDITVYDTQTRLQKWQVRNPEHGVTNIATGDVDGDGAVEVIWGAGWTSSGPDYLYVVNWQTRQYEWSNVHLDGPFIGPEIGDLDGDGRYEIVAVTWQSESGYGSGRILVFDGNTRRLRGISDELVRQSSWTGTRDLKLRDVDGDGRPEILVGADELYDGVIEIYDFDSSNNFTMIWTNATQPDFAAFDSVNAADIDNDGDIEIVGCGGGYVRVYNYLTRNEEWASPQINGWLTRLEIANIDNDSSKEIIVLAQGGNAFIFDGTTKTLEATLTGPFSDMHINTINGAPSVVLGNFSGDMIVYRYQSGAYAETFRQRLISGPIDGLTIGSQDRVWVGSNGKLHIVTLSGTTLWTYDSGSDLSYVKRTAFLPDSPFFFTAGLFSIVGFSTGADENEFDMCLQDDSSGNLLQFNSTTGDYQFVNCESNLTLSGKGTLMQRSGNITLQHNAADRRVSVKLDTRVKRGTASIQVFSLGRTFTITDRDTTNNTCGCP